MKTCQIKKLSRNSQKPKIDQWMANRLETFQQTDSGRICSNGRHCVYAG